MKILVIDNYDSFTFNLVHYIEKLCAHSVVVIKNDQITPEKAMEFDKIMISPGPGIPSESGNLMPTLEVIKESKDIFGVCLGLQAIVASEGGKLLNSEKVFHGIARPVKIVKNDPLFHEIPNHFLAGRYHSWVADTHRFPPLLEILAVDEDGWVMAIKHKTKKIRAVQFHPESILTEYGEKIISNWLHLSYENTI